MKCGHSKPKACVYKNEPNKEMRLSNSLFLLSPEVRDYAVHGSVFSLFGDSNCERLHCAYLSRLHSDQVTQEFFEEEHELLFSVKP